MQIRNVDGRNSTTWIHSKDRGLIINHKEAELVRAIYNNFVETNSVTETVRKINKEGHKTKSWISEKERFMKEKAFSKKQLDIFYKTQFMLGRFFTKGDVYDGKHEAIIPQDLWDKVQTLFKRRDQVAKPNTRISAPPLLKGILSCGCCGTSMT